MPIIDLTISGQCPSGKNAVCNTRTGHKYPNQRFVKWRAKALAELKKQLNKIRLRSDVRLPFCHPIHAGVIYAAGDKRRRDVPGILDALWHLLEKAGIVSDDRYLADFKKDLIFRNLGLNRKNPHVRLILGY